MKYNEELNLISYKVGEIKKDMKELVKLEQRITKLEKFMYYCLGALTLISASIPVLLFFMGGGK